MKKKAIILSIFIFLVSLLITLNVIFHESLREELVEQYNKQQLLIAKAVADSIYRTLDHVKEESVNLARLLTKRRLKGEELQEFIATAFEEVNKETQNSLILTDEDGRVIYSTIKGTTIIDDDMILIQKSKEIKEGEVYFVEKVKEERTLKMITPVIKSGRFIGSLLVTINVDAINKKFLSDIKSGQRGYAWMIDNSGTLIYHPTQPDMIGNNLYGAKEECFRCHHSFDLEKTVIESNIDYGRHIAPTGEDKILAFSRINIGNIKWTVCVSSPYTEVISITSRSMRLYSILVVAIFTTVFIGALIIVLINRRQVKIETDSKKAILLEKRKLDTIVSAIGSGLMLLDNNHKILWINKTLKEWAGDIVGRECSDICNICNMRSGGSGDGITHDLYRGTFGKRKGIFQITSAPVKDTDGKTIGILKLIQDVTEIKKLEEGIARSERLAALGRLAAGVTHEIGNPLTSISSFVQILKERTHDEFTRDSLETIHYHIKRISDIMGQVSQLSRLPEMEIKECDINSIINSTLEIIKYDKKTKGIELKKELADKLPPVYVDDGYLSQVFINLILNAVDAMEDRGGTLTIKTMKENNYVMVEFADTGVGIPDDYIRSIFDPFFTTKEKGTGLGLPISYEIVKRFGGEIRVRSEQGIGSIFSVILPVKEVE
ncbi:MAG: sensor histidine kinase [Thermodesulfovibrionia bacterium]